MAGGGGTVVGAVSLGDGVGLSGGGNNEGGGVCDRGSNGAGLGCMGAEHGD